MYKKTLFRFTQCGEVIVCSMLFYLQVKNYKTNTNGGKTGNKIKYMMNKF